MSHESHIENLRTKYIYDLEGKTVARRHRGGNNATYTARTEGCMRGRVYARLLNMGYTQDEVGEMVGYGRDTIRRYVTKDQRLTAGDVWKQHPTLPIQVSTNGLVKRRGNILNQYTRADGRKVVTLYLGKKDNGKQNNKCLAVHRLVAETFIQSDIEGLHVHHRDVNPGNNDLSNLQVMTEEDHIELHRQLREDNCMDCDPTMGVDGVLCTNHAINRSIIEFEFGEVA